MRIRNFITEGLIFGGATIGSYLNNNTNLIPRISNSDLFDYARDLDHLFAGIGIPYAIGLTLRLDRSSYPIPHNGLFKFFAYASTALSWELMEAMSEGINRPVGYFQFDQIFWDMTGVGIGYALQKLVLNRS